MAPKNNIVLVRQEMPKKVTLSNGRTFHANFRRAMHVDLPAQVTVEKTYKDRPIKKKELARKLPKWLSRASRHRKAKNKKRVRFGNPFQAKLRKYMRPPRQQPRIVRIPGQGPTLVRQAPNKTKTKKKSGSKRKSSKKKG